MSTNTHDLNPNGLSLKQEKAIIALLSEPSVKRAADVVGVGETTIFRWLNEETFRSAYLEARRKVLQQATARMQHYTSEATSILQSLMTDTKQPASARIAAARTIIQSAFTGLQLEDQSKRLAEIQDLLKEPSDGPNY